MRLVSFGRAVQHCVTDDISSLSRHFQTVLACDSSNYVYGGAAHRPDLEHANRGVDRRRINLMCGPTDCDARIVDPGPERGAICRVAACYY